ncbi:MAG: excinuclease ABC subunit UvrA, partial [Candidatus Methanoperedens sp.]|nr:excinuclease ABC subunit UvrA [Candidatus Methanoperedens sp.]
ELNPQHFSFNHPLGMCPTCHGLGRKLELDPDLIVPDKDRSVVDGAIVPWKNVFQDGNDSYGARSIRRKLEAFAEKNNISLTRPWKQLTAKAQDRLLYGDDTVRGGYRGIMPEMEQWYEKTSSEGFRNYLLQTFMRRIPCETCGGGRLRPEYLAARVSGKSIVEITHLDISGALEFFQGIALSPKNEKIAGSVLKEIKNRLRFLKDVGLEYLTLSRSAPSLSGGEAQRIRLASQIGSALVGVLYVLDEPSIGLHQRDNRRLIDTLIQLRDLGNTVLVVEHDKEMIESADFIVDFGPGAGRDGGEVVVAGTLAEVVNHKPSRTGAYLSGRKEILIPKIRRKGTGKYIEILGAEENNLKSIDVKIPLGVFTCVTGVSGSGKSTLITEILFKALDRLLHRAHTIPGKHKAIQGIEHID